MSENKNTATAAATTMPLPEPLPGVDPKLVTITAVTWFGSNSTIFTPVMRTYSANTVSGRVAGQYISLVTTPPGFPTIATVGQQVDFEIAVVATTETSAPTTTVQTETSVPPGSSGTSFPTMTMPPNGTDPSPSPPTRESTNTGAIVGAAVGCLIAGLLLGFAAAFFLFRKRQRQQPKSTDMRALDAHALAPLSGQGGPKDELSHFLLDSIPDNEIASEMKSRDMLIEQHVDANYHRGPIHADQRILSMSLVNLGVSGSGNLTTEGIAALALNPQTRPVALRHVISQVVFSSVDASARSNLSMLPAPVAAFLQSIPPREKGKSNGEMFAFALNRWRVLSAFLLHPARSERTPLPAMGDATIGSRAADLTTALNTFLGYFVGSDEASRLQQQSHLRDVIADCTKLGYVVFSQPQEMEFVHHVPHQQNQKQNHHSVIVCAGVVKITDRDGKPYNNPRTVVEPSIVTI